MTTPEFRTGSLFDSGCDALVNPVNTIGVHGKGLALEFKTRCPSAVNWYTLQCTKKLVKPGDVYYYEGTSLRPPWVIFFVTKLHWRDPSKLQWIDDGLYCLIGLVRERKIKTLAIPAIGCGLGQLQWTDVKPLIVNAVQHMDCEKVVVYEPLPLMAGLGNRIK